MGHPQEHLAGVLHDTVRGVFQEGGPAFPGSAIRRWSHVQIAVRNRSAIEGFSSRRVQRSEEVQMSEQSDKRT